MMGCIIYDIPTVLNQDSHLSFSRYENMKQWTFARDTEVELCSVLAMYKLILAGLFPRVSPAHY